MANLWLIVLCLSSGAAVVAVLSLVLSWITARTGRSGPGHLLSRPRFWLACLAICGIGILGSALILTYSPPVPNACVPGSISVQGSSAFAPTANLIARNYMSMCPRSIIKVTATDSHEAVRDLEAAGPPTAKTKAGTISIAMSDGQAPNANADLILHPEGIVIFSVIVNKTLGIKSLKLVQIQAIYSGRIRNWQSFHGPKERIMVVDREGTSGTRATFQQKVLESAHRMARATFATSTGEMLAAVDGNPSAIGYAETTASGSGLFTQITQLRLNGYRPINSNVKNGKYPFWAVEYFYTYGAPRHGSLIEAFLRYLTSYTSSRIMQAFGHVPCQDSEGGILVQCTRDIGPGKF